MKTSDASLPARRILCALSGGMDSVCMTHYLCSQPDLEIAAAHFSHGIRPEDAEKEYELCKRLCESLGIKLYHESGDSPECAAQKGIGLEEAARELRYDFLKRAAKEFGADRIATAHHARDNAETLIFNLIRGTGSMGCGIPRDDVLLWRPLLSWPREKIERYIEEHSLEYAQDPTNAVADAARNRIRLELLPLLEAIHPGAVENLARSAETVRADGEFIEELAREQLEKGSYYEDGCRFPAALFLELPGVLSGRLFRLAFSRCGGGLKNLGQVHFQAFIELCRAPNPSARIDLPDGFSAMREYDDVIIARSLPESSPLPAKLGEGSTVWGEWIITVLDAPAPGAIAAPDGKLTVRARLEGDRVCGKNLKQLMIDRKIPRRERGGIPILCSDGVPFWAPIKGLKCEAAGSRYIKTEKIH